MKDYTNYQNVPGEEEKPQNESTNSKKEKTGIVINCRAVNIRKGPNKNAEVLGTIPVGEEVAIKSNYGKGWFGVCTEEIPKGYIMEEFIKEK